MNDLLSNAFCRASQMGSDVESQGEWRISLNKYVASATR